MAGAKLEKTRWAGIYRRGPIVAQTSLAHPPVAAGGESPVTPKRVWFAGDCCRSSSVVVLAGAASQAEGRGFDPRRPLEKGPASALFCLN
jgi:hypothetical protein